MRAKAAVIVSLIASFIFVGWIGRDHIVGAQEAAEFHATALPGYTTQIDSIMDMLGKGRIDDALAAIDLFKDEPDAKQAMRDRLIRFNSEQHRYFGYDIVAVQRFSGRLQEVSVVANYDERPLLFRFDFYHPESGGNQPWLIPGFSMHENVVEELKDVPVDYRPVTR